MSARQRSSRTVSVSSLTRNKARELGWLAASRQPRRPPTRNRSQHGQPESVIQIPAGQIRRPISRQNPPPHPASCRAAPGTEEGEGLRGAAHTPATGIPDTTPGPRDNSTGTDIFDALISQLPAR